MSDKTCKTCEWWIPYVSDPEIGTCTVFPEWRPMMRGMHWCGQWKKAEILRNDTANQFATKEAQT